MNVVSNQSVSAPSARIVPVFQALAEDLRAMGVEQCFGLMSDDTIGLTLASKALTVPAGPYFGWLGRYQAALRETALRLEQERQQAELTRQQDRRRDHDRSRGR